MNRYRNPPREYQPPEITWAPRVSRDKILKLYQNTADGIHDEKLIDDIAWSLWNRCADIIRVTDGVFSCPDCKEELPHHHIGANDLNCEKCGWRMPWSDFELSFRRKQLTVNTGAPGLFIDGLTGCESPQDKVILIDSLIHACHISVRNGETYYTRPLAVNLIEGTMRQVIAFLENLPYGPESATEMTEELSEWRKRCLSITSDLSAERYKVSLMVDSIPDNVLIEVEAMIEKNHRQKAAARLAMFREYNVKLKVLRGTTPMQMVRIIEKRINDRTISSERVKHI